MATFTDSERDRILHFLGYPKWTALAQSIQLGYPMASQPLFLVYDAFVRIDSGGVENALRDLCQCESIENQLADARSRFKATSVGNINLNAKETAMLRDELKFWTKRLADDLGVVVNPYSQMAWQGMQGGISTKVSG
jgi:hypothetical protein